MSIGTMDTVLTHTISALGAAVIVAIIARPLVVALCLLPFRYPAREIAFIGWMGLRGAVPIILATVPVLARAPGAERIFDLVFFVVAVSELPLTVLYNCSWESPASTKRAPFPFFSPSTMLVV